MIDIERILNHPNTKFLVIELLNKKKRWLADTIVSLGCFKEKSALYSAISEYVQTLYRLQSIYGVTAKSYSEFLLTDEQIPRAVMAYLLNSCFASNRDNFFPALCAIYIALEDKDYEFQKQRSTEDLVAALYLFLISNFQKEESVIAA